MATARDIIEQALKKIGVFGVGSSLSAEDAQDAYEALNRFMSVLSIDGNIVYYEPIEQFPLVGGTADYTIGTGQTFNTTRPTEIIEAWVRDGTIDYYLTKRDDAEYAPLTLKSLRAIPEEIYFDNNYPSATLTFYPVPDKAYTLFLQSKKPFTAFTGLTDTVNLPPAYEDMLVYNMAVRLAADYEKEAPPFVQGEAQRLLLLIQAQNTKNKKYVMGVDNALVGDTSFNIYSGRPARG